MSVCVPIRDLKDTAKFSNLIESENEVIVTKNGYTASSMPKRRKISRTRNANCASRVEKPYGHYQI